METRPEWMPYGSSWDSQKWIDLALMNEGCNYKGRGMFELEFKHFKQLYRLQAELEPTTSNSILRLGGAGGGRGVLAAGKAEAMTSNSILRLGGADVGGGMPAAGEAGTHDVKLHPARNVCVCAVIVAVAVAERMQSSRMCRSTPPPLCACM